MELGQSLKICISNKFPEAAAAVGATLRTPGIVARNAYLESEKPALVPKLSKPEFPHLSNGAACQMSCLLGSLLGFSEVMHGHASPVLQEHQLSRSPGWRPGPTWAHFAHHPWKQMDPYPISLLARVCSWEQLSIMLEGLRGLAVSFRTSHHFQSPVSSGHGNPAARGGGCVSSGKGVPSMDLFPLSGLRNVGGVLGIMLPPWSNLVL